MCDNDELEVGMVLAFIDDAENIDDGYCVLHINETRSYSTRLAASASIFSVSKAFVGSSNARMPQF